MNIHKGMSPTSPHVLIISTKIDTATDDVIKKLALRGAHYTRINTEDFPFNSTLTAGFISEKPFIDIKYRRDALPHESLGSVSSIWYRRVRSPERPQDMNPGVHDFCLRESRAALLGIVSSIKARFMSPPSAIWAAEQKPFQLKSAQAADLHIPKTMITNDPDEIRKAYVLFNGRMIAKPVKTGFVDYGDEQQAIYTSQVLEEHLSEIDGARLSPVIYQELIPKQCDVRVTAVGGTLFVAEIDSQSDVDASLDWRRTSNPKLPHRRAELPDSVHKALLRLLDNLGLQFGAIDLIRTPENEYFFLEVNPNGQWLWLDDMLGFGISDAIASWLIGK